MTPQEASPESKVVVPPPPHAAPSSEWRQRTLFELLEAAPRMARRATEERSERRPYRHGGRAPRDANGFKLPRMHPALSKPRSLTARVLAYVRAKGPAGATRTEIAEGMGMDYGAVAPAVNSLLGGCAGAPWIPMLKSAGEKVSPFGTRHALVAALADAELETGATRLEQDGQEGKDSLFLPCSSCPSCLPAVATARKSSPAQAGVAPVVAASAAPSDDPTARATVAQPPSAVPERRTGEGAGATQAGATPPTEVATTAPRRRRRLPAGGKSGPFPKTSEVSGPETHLMKVLRFIQARGAEGTTRWEIAQATGLEEEEAGSNVRILLGEQTQLPRRPEIERSGRSRPGASGFPSEVLVAIGGQ